MAKCTKRAVLFAPLALAALFGVSAKADTNPITVDAGWYGFCFGASTGDGAYVGGCQNSGIGQTGNDITFTATTDVLLNVTDAFNKGDTFTVDISGPTSGSFSTDTVPIVSGSTTDPQTAFEDPSYSSGSWELAPGSYTVDIYALDSPYGGGGAYVEAITDQAAAVPEPSGLLLLATAIGLVGVGTRLKKRSTAA